MPGYRVSYTMRGVLEVEADSEAEAEKKGYQMLREVNIPTDDYEIHCVEEEGYGGYNG